MSNGSVRPACATIKRMPGRPATWSACICEKQMAPSWRKPQPRVFQGICVPSPQSKSVNVDPQRTNALDSHRPGNGIMPQVPSIQISIMQYVLSAFSQHLVGKEGKVGDTPNPARGVPLDPLFPNE